MQVSGVQEEKVREMESQNVIGSLHHLIAGTVRVGLCHLTEPVETAEELEVIHCLDLEVLHSWRTEVKETEDRRDKTEASN